MDNALSPAFAALDKLAREIDLETILLQLRDFYRAVQEDAFTRTNVDYERVCLLSLRALDAALWRLETDSV